MNGDIDLAVQGVALSQLASPQEGFGFCSSCQTFAFALLYIALWQGGEGSCLWITLEDFEMLQCLSAMAICVGGMFEVRNQGYVNLFPR